MTTWHHDLPPQPTPALFNTLARCQKNVSPPLTNLQRLKCQSFLQLYGLANKRHQRVLAQATPGAAINWSAEGLKRLYLSCRGGLAFHNNYPVVLCDDPQATSMVERAGCLIVAALALHADIFEGSLMVETEGGVPLDMGQYRSCFSTHRVPQRICDRHMSHANSSHIAVLIAGRLYQISIAGDKRSVAENINLVLARILRDVRHRRDTNDKPEPCMLTALPREYWARTREMMQQDEQNQQILRILNEALFVVCLDIHCAPATLGETLALVRDGNAQNRYYDKTTQIVVFENGKAGLCFEHAAVDGSVALGFAAQLQRRAHGLHESYSLRSTPRNDEPILDIKQLGWVIDRRLRARLSFAQEYVLGKIEHRKLLAGSSSLGGRKRLRCYGLNPDATIQMAIQMAVNRILGKRLNVLEPVQIRRFAGGRLDFVPTVTPESWAFVEAVQRGLNGAVVAQRLHAAVKAHGDLIAQSKAGQGAMAHLLALSAVAFPNDPVKGVHVQTRRQNLLAFLDQGLNLIINHDVMAANGSGFPEIAAFGTITSKPDSLGIGYVIDNDAVVFDVRADGRYRERCSGLIAGIDDCLRTLAHITKDSSGLQTLAGKESTNAPRLRTDGGKQCEATVWN
jgi:carnitine O-acetyltransferase